MASPLPKIQRSEGSKPNTVTTGCAVETTWKAGKLALSPPVSHGVTNLPEFVSSSFKRIKIPTPPIWQEQSKQKKEDGGRVSQAAARSPESSRLERNVGPCRSFLALGGHPVK